MRLTVIRDIDDTTGTVVAEEHWMNEQRHRDGDLPAVMIWDAATGNLACEAYLKNGSLHRDYGQPAVVQRSPATGEIVCEEYWIEGVKREKAQAEDMSRLGGSQEIPRKFPVRCQDGTWLNQLAGWFGRSERNVLARPH